MLPKLLSKDTKGINIMFYIIQIEGLKFFKDMTIQLFVEKKVEP